MTKIERIRARAEAGAFVLTTHAQQAAIEDAFTRDDVGVALDGAVLVEDYPDDPRGPFCLVWGKARDGRDVHVVCTTDTKDVVVIAVYEPTPPRWVTPTQRGTR